MTHNHCLAKSIHDAAWSQFFAQLSSKAQEAGRQFVKIAPAYTTQDCSRCHHRQYMPLETSVYECACCGLILDRDHNASLNILALGLQSLGIQPGEAPCL
jgi:putative transposase